MNFENVVFRRLFSLNMRKKLRIRLAEMSFENDFTVTERGNLYPLISISGNTYEKIENGVYSVRGGSFKRLICEHFPFAEYSMNILMLSGKAGFSFYKNDTVIDLYIESVQGGYKAAYSVNGKVTHADIFVPSDAQSVSFGARGKTVDIYYTVNGHYSLSGSVDIPELESACDYPFPFKALFFCEAECFETDKIEAYLDNGLALADIKPIRYTDGSLLMKAGKIYFTMSSRLGAGGYQSVISWIPGTSEFRLEGAIFFDVSKKGKISGDVASCILYDREKEEYLIWMCAFSSGHILGFGRTDSDILHSVSIIDITLMNQKDGASETEFYGFDGDEDPDFYYDEKKKKWYLSVCRLRWFNDKKTYSYVKFESDDPFSGYEFYAATGKTGETGGMTTEIDGKRYFVCGAEMSETSKYRIYDADTLQMITEAEYDYPDGGFRGWGTVFPVKSGNRQRVIQITFDRVLGSDFNWSYGNLYAFEAIEKNKRVLL